MPNLTPALMLPEKCHALLWDMDGVLIDSLGLDQTICAALFTHYVGRPVVFSHALIRSLFALDPARFIDALMVEVEKESAVTHRDSVAEDILNAYEEVRRTARFPLLPGVHDTLVAAQRADVPCAVVSNNPSADLHKILRGAGIYDFFDVVVGNDEMAGGRKLQKKPAPDTYIYAAEKLGVMAKDCVVFEDSVLGCRAGLAAGAYVIGLLTGSADRADLEGLTPKAPQQILDNLIGAA